MEKIKSLFDIEKKVFAIDEKDELFFLDIHSNLWLKSSLFSKKDDSSKILVYQSSSLLEISKHKVLIYDLEKKFIKASEQIFEKSISLVDTFIIQHFLCICFDNGEYFIINLKTFEGQLFSSDLFLLNTNGEKIIEWNSDMKEIVITEKYSVVSKIRIQESYIDKASDIKKIISIEKAIKKHESNQFILQANYNYLYLLDLENNKISSSVFIKNIFLGDTISFEHGDYHITSEIIYKIDWQRQKIEPVLNWSKETGCNTFPGVSILLTYEDVIVFIGTSAKIVIFYSFSSNQIISYSFLSAKLYKNPPYIFLEDKIYLVDCNGLIHLLEIPK